MTQTEFEALIADSSKRIDGNLAWNEDEDHSPAVEFRAEVTSDPGYPLFIRGSYNRLASTLSFTLIHRGAGRIYALDLGKEHHNPSCQHIGETHKHRWSELMRDKEAYKPEDITATVQEPLVVWQQFCTEACITHHGAMQIPPPIQGDLL